MLDLFWNSFRQLPTHTLSRVETKALNDSWIRPYCCLDMLIHKAVTVKKQVDDFPIYQFQYLTFIQLEKGHYKSFQISLVNNCRFNMEADIPFQYLFYADNWGERILTSSVHKIRRFVLANSPSLGFEIISNFLHEDTVPILWKFWIVRDKHDCRICLAYLSLLLDSSCLSITVEWFNILKTFFRIWW